MKLYRYFTKEEIEKYEIEDGKIYDDESKIEPFAYMNEDDVLPNSFILDNFKIYEVDLFGEKYFPDEYSCKIYANKLQILNEINYEEFCNKIFSEYLQEQLQVIKLKTDEILNKVVNSQYTNCRAAVAVIGRDCDLDKLVHDESTFVKLMVLNHKRPQDIKTLIKSDTDIEILLKIADFDLDDKCFENLLKRNYNAVIKKLFIKDNKRVIDFYKKDNNNHLSSEMIQSIIVNLKDKNIINELRENEDSETKLLLLKNLRSFQDAITFIIDKDENVRKLALEVLQDAENIIKYQNMITRYYNEKRYNEKED